MKILQLHNRYLAGLGGEDSVVEEEKWLLEEHGHTVEQTFVTTEPVSGGKLGMARAAGNMIWSRDSYALVQKVLREVEPDVMHVHNVFPVLSPSVFKAAKDLGVRTVNTLHNYRLVCANGLLMRDGGPCTLCVTGSRLNGLKYRCYRDSLILTAPHTASQYYHALAGTYRKYVDTFVVLSSFAADLFMQRGMVREKIVVKPNFLANPPQVSTEPKRNVITFVGKVVPEKGLSRLLPVWCQHFGESNFTLQIIGDGTEREALEAQYQAPNLVWRGWLDRRDVLHEVATSKWLVLPSTWFEGFPMVLLEAMYSRTPAIVPRLGAMPEIVGGTESGLVYEPGDPDMIRALSEAIAMDEVRYNEVADLALRRVQEEYSPDVSYRKLMVAYGTASGNLH